MCIYAYLIAYISYTIKRNIHVYVRHVLRKAHELLNRVTSNFASVLYIKKHIYYCVNIFICNNIVCEAILFLTSHIGDTSLAYLAANSIRLDAWPQWHKYPIPLLCDGGGALQMKVSNCQKTYMYMTKGFYGLTLLNLTWFIPRQMKPFSSLFLAMLFMSHRIYSWTNGWPDTSIDLGHIIKSQNAVIHWL